MKKVVLMGMVVLGMVFGTKIAQATDVSGNVSGNWTISGSPYIVTADATVSSGSILIIEPGVTVKFATETSLICNGTLTAIGTSVGTIIFTSDQATYTAGHWKGIKLSNSGANGSQISYCDIGYAAQAVYLENVSGATIIHNYIHDNKGKDGIDGSPGTPGEMGVGIYLYQSSNNIVERNIIPIISLPRIRNSMLISE